MRARVNAASPFARKVRIVARETDLIARIEEIDTAVSPVAANAELAAANPLVKIPTLILDDGTTLYDSRVICEYLDALAGNRLFPQSGVERWQALRLQALCDGILDAAVLIRYETAVRPEAVRWPDWIAAQRGKIEGGLAALEHAQPGFGASFGIGQVGAACVLGYLDFRFPDIAWRARYPRLEAWFAEASKRASVHDTAPPA
ncbi:MAG: glutathione S-transferase family protein [Betaproteobacteria bacterium]|nr:MAG: glutathione S-transferase family protein [Betaproteobacteria bacterium]